MLILLIVVSGATLWSGSAAAERYSDFSKPELDPTIRDNNVVASGETRTFRLSVQNRHDGSTKMGRGVDSISQIIQSHRINIGAATATSATVQAGDAPLDVRTGQQSLGTIDAGSNRQTAVTVEVDESATPGTYRLPVTVSYSYIFNILPDSDEYVINRNTETTTEYVTVRVEPSTRLAVVDTTGQSLYENAEGTVSVTVRNNGSEVASDATLLMEESSPLRPQSNDISIGRLDPGETAQASFQVGIGEFDTAGNYTAAFRLQYEDENGNTMTSAARTGSVVISPAPTYNLSAETTGLYVDSRGAVAVTVTNTGERTVRDARAVLDPLEPFTLVSSTASIGTLSPGDSGTAQFKLEASDQAIAQTYPLTVTVVHDDAYGNAVESEPQTIDVGVGPESTIQVVDTAQVSAGGTETVTYTIRNIGEETLLDAVARINTNSPFDTDDDTTYVGTLAPGEEATVSYTVSTDGAVTPKTYSLDMSVKYDNALGDTVVTDVSRAPITVTAGGSGLPFGLSGMIIVGAMVPLLLGFGVVYRTDLLSRVR